MRKLRRRKLSGRETKVFVEEGIEGKGKVGKKKKKTVLRTRRWRVERESEERTEMTKAHSSLFHRPLSY